MSQHHEDLLAQALGDVLVKAGVLRGDRGYTGVELLVAAEAYVKAGGYGGRADGGCAGDCNEGHGPTCDDPRCPERVFPDPTPAADRLGLA